MSNLPARTSLARLRHDLRTPVSHILGYVELLLEDAREQNFLGRIPILADIQQGGRRLLDAIETALSSSEGSFPEHLNLSALRVQLRETAESLLETSSRLRRTLGDNDTDALKDLDVIAQALRDLLEFAAQEETPAFPDTINLPPATQVGERECHPRGVSL